MARSEPHEEAAEEDGTDDEDAARDDADPSRDRGQSAASTFDDGGLVHGCDGRSVRYDGINWSSLGFGRRCFAHVIHSARHAEALVMNRL
jgi:hypothetical protein